MKRGRWRRYARISIGFRGCGAFLLWTAIAPIASAVTLGCSNRSTATGSAAQDAAAAELGTCRDGDRDRQRYGANCLCCHKDTFGVAGSVAHDAGVAQVKVRDRDGRIAEMYVNTYDNFFQHRRLTPPISAVIVFEDGTERSMPEPAPNASCNACHGQTTALLGAR